MRMLKNVKVQFDKQKARKLLTVDEKKEVAGKFTSQTLDFASTNWRKIINEENLRADWRKEKIGYLEDYIGSGATRTARMSENQGFVLHRRLQLVGEGVSSNSLPPPPQNYSLLSFSFKLSKLEGTSSQDRSLSPFPNLKFSLYVIFRVLSVLEEGSHDPKVLAF